MHFNLSIAQKSNLCNLFESHKKRNAIFEQKSFFETMDEIEIKSKIELKVELKKFLEAYFKTKILEAKDDSLQMYILLSKNKNKTPKEKLINFKLLRINERLFIADEELSIRDSIICEFLIVELQKYVQKSLK